MSELSWTKSFYIGNDTALRSWLSDWKAKLTTLGLVRLTQGSPIDDSTIVRGTHEFSQYGHIIGSDIWQSDDTKADFYIKFDYYAKGGNNTNGTDNQVDRIAARYQIGFATDGAGNLIGKRSEFREFLVIGEYQQNSYNGASDQEVQAATENYFSGDGSRLTFQHGGNAPFIAEYPANDIGTVLEQSLKIKNGNGYGYSTQNYLAGALTIERSKNDNGTDSEDGIIIASCALAHGGDSFYSSNNGTTYNQVQYLPLDSTRPLSISDSWNCVYNGARASTLYGQSLNIFPIIPYLGGKQMNPPIGLAGCLDFDLPVGLTTGVEIYGSLKTYRKTANYMRVVNGSQWLNSRLIMLAE